MRPGVNRTQLTLRDMGVNLRRADIRVLEELLHVADIGSVIKHVGGRRVAKDRAGAGDQRAASADALADLAAQRTAGDARAVVRQKQRGTA